MLRYPSIAELTERQLVNCLVRDLAWRSDLLEIKGMPQNAKVLLEVPLTGLPGSPKGDIDILLIDPKRYGIATAIQVKRVKVSMATLRSPKPIPNRLRELDIGVRQANLMAEIGFSQVYLYILVVVDSREQNGGRVTYDGAPARVQSLIQSVISEARLEKRIGLVNCEFVQPMDYAPLTIGTSSGHLMQLSQELEQPPDVTRWVADQAGKSWPLSIT